jgi:hypothetical protein
MHTYRKSGKDDESVFTVEFVTTHGARPLKDFKTREAAAAMSGEPSSVRSCLLLMEVEVSVQPGGLHMKDRYKPARIEFAKPGEPEWAVMFNGRVVTRHKTRDEARRVSNEANEKLKRGQEAA